MPQYKPASVVSLKGLRPRSRGYWALGQSVLAYREELDGVTRTIVKNGPYGCDSIVPDDMIRFDKEGN